MKALFEILSAFCLYGVVVSAWQHSILWVTVFYVLFKATDTFYQRNKKEQA